MRPIIWSVLVAIQTAGGAGLPYKNYAPVVSPDDSTVAFYSTAYGNFDLFTVAVDGGRVRRLTNAPSYDGEPSWSPDGARLVFVSDRDGDDELFLIDADGTGLRQLTENEGRDDYPAWSPESGRIVFRSDRDGTYRLYAIDPADGTTTLFADHAVDGRLRWSRDGAQLVFSVEHGSGSAFVRLDARGEAIQELELPDVPGAGNPQISPDGSRVLFDAHSERSTESGDGLWELWTVDLERREPTRLTHNDVDDWGASWAHDGTWIVFAGGGRNNEGYEIFRMNADGTGQRQLTRRGEF